MKTLLTKQNLIKFIMLFYVFSVILDLHVFYNSISTLIRTVIISVVFVIILIKYASKKEKRMLSGYFVLLGIYLVFHLINATNYAGSVTTIYSNLSELLYFYKMVINLLLFYIIYKLEITLEDSMKSIKLCLWFICGSILFCNIFKLGYGTYDFMPIKANIFDWFRGTDVSYDDVSGKGYFHLANQIIAIILLYLPLLINDIKKHFNIIDICLPAVALLSMLILGNRLSTAGPLIILICAVLIYLFLVLIKKEKFKWNYFIYLLANIIIYNIFLFYSPLLKRNEYYDNLTATEQTVLSDPDQIDVEADIIDNFNNKKINLNFPLIYYKYENDPEFWNSMLKKDTELLVDARYLEISIIKRVKSFNNNSLDNWLGIGYHRVINIFNIERDYVMQYYSIGIIGLILMLGLYFLIYIYCIFRMLINLENNFNYQNIMLFLGVGIFLIAAYFSGNILNAASTIIPVSFILGIVNNEISKKYKSANPYLLGYKISKLDEQEILKIVKNNLKSEKQSIIYNINPLIMTNFYKDKKIKEEINKSDTSINDGVGTILATKMKYDINLKRVAGIDFFDQLCLLAQEQKHSVYLWGAKEENIKKCKIKLEERFPNIKIIGVSSGYESVANVLKKIKKLNPNFLFIGMGSPKQEKIIIENKKSLKNIKLIMPVGGTFDVICGKLKRAPKIFIKLHLEWLYRMGRQPRRIVKNMNLIKFLILVIFRNDWYNKLQLNSKIENELEGKEI